MNRLADMAIEGATAAKVAPPPVWVTLTWSEMSLASIVAVRRRLESMRDNHAPKYGASHRSAPWDMEIFSAQGELTIAKYLNLYWSGINGIIKAVDVGGEEGAEVRTRSKHWYELILHPEDADERPHVLVTTEAPPAFCLVGWIYGNAGKREQYWDDPAGNRAAFFVPHCDLRPMAELKQTIGSLPYVEKGSA
jgi:hypothetical protein